ncbi:uncharacterized protein JCM15063_005416 [Sporobolomyces koalae]|uniref:uncharacterized protein n=1 Tax=Sporobolomyces koalae TaxID=500713 RepID=UPI0031707C18
MSSGLHRRTSSAALHYSSLPGNEGQDISLFTSSNSRQPPRAASVSHHSAVPVTGSGEDELEEKDGLLASGPRRASHASTRTKTRERSKCRILFLFMVVSSTALILYAVVAGWVQKRDVERVWGDWKTWTSKQEETWAGSTNKNTSEIASLSKLNSSASNSIESLLSAKARPLASSVSSLASRPSLSSSSKLRPSTLHRNMTYGSFSPSRMKAITELADAGNLSSYRWHDTLPSLKTKSSYFSQSKQNGRLIVVGDLHGTHRSLFRLLYRISYTPSHDTLVHTGDILSKSTLDNSLTTIALLRKLGAKGVRGNHDQKVLEWRNWMNELGPLNQTAAAPADDLDESATYGGAAKGKTAKLLQAPVGDYRSKRGSWDTQRDARSAKLRAPQPRKEKRDWLHDWLSSNAESPEANDDNLEELEDYEDNAETTAPAYEEDDYFSTTSSATTSSARVKATDRRRPFGQRPQASSSDSFSAASTRVASAVPSGYPSKSKLSSSTNTTLLGPLYGHLDPNLGHAQRSRLGIKVPTGWEWGSEHFEIARHLQAEDVAYLESLPLTLWIEELNSFVVHAGMVPWTDTPESSFSSLSSSLARSTLESTSSSLFVPAASTAKSLESTLRGSLLLNPQNTDPFTLLNLRTLSLVHPASHSGQHSNVKGPATEWQVSSKSRKAGKNSQPWWSVWENGMQEFEQGVAEPGQTVGIVYGHWASQGLQVQNHSIGLDSGCVYGRQLSALVLELSSNSSPLSPLASATSVASKDRKVTPSSLSRSPQATGSVAVTNVRPSLLAGQNRLDRITKGAASPRTSTLTASTSTATGSSKSSDYEEEEDDEAETKPWWKPWKRSGEEDSEGDEEADFQNNEDSGVELEKRAPPQFRPLGGLDESRLRSAALADEDEDELKDSSQASITSSSSSSSATTVARNRKQYGHKMTTASSAASSSASSLNSTAHSLPTSRPSKLRPESFSGIKNDQVQDQDDEQDINELPILEEEAQNEAADDDEEKDPEDLFSAKEFTYEPLGQERNKVWIVSVDCAVEVEMDTE